MSATSTTKNDNFIYAQNKSFFGGNQERFIHQSNIAIAWGVSEIREGLRPSRKLSEQLLFILGGFSRMRNSLAMEASNRLPDAREFGRERMYCPETHAYTPLSGRYIKYNDKMHAFFQHIIDEALPERRFSTQNKKPSFTHEVEDVDGKHSFEFQIITQNDIHANQWDIPLPQTTFFSRVHSDIPQDLVINRDHNPPTPWELQKIESYNTSLRRFATKHPEAYQHDVFYELFKRINCFYQLGQSDLEVVFIKGTAYTPKMTGKPGERLELSQYINWTFLNKKTGCLEPFGEATVTIIHQDRFLIEESLQEISYIFAKAVHLVQPQENIDVLKSQVARIRFLFSDAMICARGSAAMGEWLEKIIYNFHNLECSYNPNMSGDLEALTAPLWPVFRRVYDETIVLTNTQREKILK